MREDLINDLMRECSAYMTKKTKEIYNLVPGSGNINGSIMVIGSSPTAKEEATGIFLNGKPREVLEGFLEGISLSMDNIYMTYAVKFRPYTINERTGRIIRREVTSDEIEMFAPYLVEEIEIFKPKMMIVLGDVAFRTLGQSNYSYEEAVGKKRSFAVGETIYDVLVLPHPKERRFAKIELDDAIINGMKLRVEDTRWMDEEPQEPEKERIKEHSQPQKQQGRHESKSNENQYQTTEESAPRKATAFVKESKIASRATYVKKKKDMSGGRKKVIVVYGGSSLADDPTYVAVERVSSVLTELSVSISRIDLYKEDNNIEAFLRELEEADGVVLATTVEWYGIGGLMQTFLDKCYNSKRFSAFNGVYLFGVVISRQSYERDAYQQLIKSWEILGGVEGNSLLGSIENSADIETDSDLLAAIDKKTEDYYRIVNQKRMTLPTSIIENRIVMRMPSGAYSDEGEQMDMKHMMSREEQESSMDNQMSFISNYDEFIEKQQKDIEDISSLFKERLTTKSEVSSKTFPQIFEYKYKPDKSFGDCVMNWVVNDRPNESFLLDFHGGKLKAKHSKRGDGDVVMSSTFDVLRKITEGKISVQRAFMTGEIKAKGNFTLLYKIDKMFAFA